MLPQSKDNLSKRAKVKGLGIRLAAHLFRENPRSPLRYSYLASMGCSKYIFQEGKKLYSKYCKCRWCPVCGRIRTGKLIKGYEAPLLSLSDPYFVTLTKRSVKASELPQMVASMDKAWRNIVNGKTGRKQRLRGVLKAECTSGVAGYHYHFHAIVEGRDNAGWVVDEWLKRMGDEALPSAQNMKPADSGSLKELFKYFTKLSVPAKGGISAMDFKSMDVIFNALRGKRTYRPFGGIRPISEEFEDLQSEEFEDLVQANRLWTYEPEEYDWLNEVGQHLTGFRPTRKQRQLWGEVPKNVIDQVKPVRIESHDSTTEDTQLPIQLNELPVAPRVGAFHPKTSLVLELSLESAVDLMGLGGVISSSCDNFKR